MPYWITDSLAGIPAFLWIYAGLGGLWSLAILPRADWRRPVQVIAVAFALGPALLTAWMFVLGTLGAAAQTAMLTDAERAGRHDRAGADRAGAGAARQARARSRCRRLPESPTRAAAERRTPADRAGRCAALVVRWVVIAYWPFTAYDALWVYGYEGRLYALLGYIPQTIGYYPQFLPLQYAFAQLGGINDHTGARGADRSCTSAASWRRTCSARA